MIFIAEVLFYFHRIHPVGHLSQPYPQGEGFRFCNLMSSEDLRNNSNDKPFCSNTADKEEVSDFPLHGWAEEHLFDFAFELRKKMTKAEKVLWGKLRAKRFMNLKFRRQHPILTYIADFYCHELRLIIEADGGYHNRPKVKLLDKARTEEFNRFGITVIRFTNQEILTDKTGVLETLKKQILLLEPDIRSKTYIRSADESVPDEAKSPRPSTNFPFP